MRCDPLLRARPLWGAPCLLVCCLAACGAPPPAATLTPAAAAAARLVADGPTCVGPWLYEPSACYAAAPRPECGVAQEATYASYQPRALCRRPEFGLEHFYLQDTHPWQKTAVTRGVDLCEHIATVPVDELYLAQNACEQEWTQAARAALDPRSYAICELASSDCRFGGANTYHEMRFRARIMAPTFEARADSPLCAPSGAAHTHQVAPAQHRACRHRLNGTAPTATCDAAGRTLVSPGSMSRRELAAFAEDAEAAKGARCTTCDEADAATRPTCRTAMLQALSRSQGIDATADEVAALRGGLFIAGHAARQAGAK